MKAKATKHTHTHAHTGTHTKPINEIYASSIKREGAGEREREKGERESTCNKKTYK